MDSDSRCEISIATLHPAKDQSSEVVCTLSRTWLDENTIPYEAVSYAWDQHHVNIIVNDNAFKISGNLKSALIALRDDKQPRNLWVDAICIPQDEEKIAQELPRIRLAFEHAQRTIIWLGSASDDSDLAMDHLAYQALRQRRKDAEGLFGSCWNILVKTTIGVLFITMRSLRYGYEILSHVLGAVLGLTHVIKLRRSTDQRVRGLSEAAIYPFEILLFMLLAIPVCGAIIAKEMLLPPPSIKSDPGMETISALRKFFERRWFTRIWMVEEVIIAKSAVVICGSRVLPWSHLTDACYMIDSIVCSETGPSPYLDCLYHRVDAFAAVMELHDLHPSILRQRTSLLYLITAFSHLDAFNSRDKIKALLGLSTDKQVAFGQDVRSAPVMFAATVKSIVESSNSLDVLRACLFKGTVQDLPSWVPDWTVKNIRSVSGMTYHMDPWHLESQNLSTRDSPVATFSPDLKCMTVQGIVVARLKHFESIWSYSRRGSFIQHADRHREMIASFTNGAITDGRIDLACANPTRIIPLLSNGLKHLLSDTLKFLWLIPGFSNLVGLAGTRDWGGFGFMFRTWGTVLGESSRIMNRGHPGLWPLTWEGIAAKMNPEGDDATTTTVWYTEGLVDGVTLDPAENKLKFLETYAAGGEPGDMVVILIGAKLPFIVRRVDDSIRTTDDGVAVEPAGSSFRLIGPAGFGGFAGNTMLWNRTKKLYFEGKHKLETLNLV